MIGEHLVVSLTITDSQRILIIIGKGCFPCNFPGWREGKQQKGAVKNK
jgi:hypothetical protein